MAFLSIQSRSETAAPVLLSDLLCPLRTLFARLASRSRKSPEQILAAQTRRAEARVAVDRLLR